MQPSASRVLPETPVFLTIGRSNRDNTALLHAFGAGSTIDPTPGWTRGYRGENLCGGFPLSHPGAYGDTLATAFRLASTPTLVTRSLHKARLAATEIRCDRERFGMTAPIPREDAYLVALQIRPCERHELWIDERPVAVSPIIGGETMIYDLRRNPIAHMDSTFHSLHFYLPRSALDWIAEDIGAHPVEDLDCPAGTRVDDPVIRALGTALMPALSCPETINATFADHALLAIAAHTAHRYGHMRATRRMSRGGLAAWQERRAKDLLSEHMVDGVSLTHIACECGLSVSHFSRAFRHTTGFPPHQWLLLRRIDRARELLRDPSRALLDIALDCGFADQSHFTRVFTRTIGVAPGIWRRSL